MQWTEKRKERMRLIAKARSLVVDKGMMQNKAALQLGVAERTLMIWGKKYGWKMAKLSYRKKETVKEKVFRLVVLDGKSQKEVAQIVGISERTISAWKKTDTWKAMQNNVDARSKNMLPLFIGYIKFVQKHNPKIAFRAESLLHEYLLQNEEFIE